MDGGGAFISDLQKEYPRYTHACLSNTHSSFFPSTKTDQVEGKKASEQTHCREPSSRKMRVSRPLETLELVHNLSWVSFLISKENAFEVQWDTENQILSVSILGSYSEPTRDTPGPQGVDQNMECLEGRMYCNTSFLCSTKHSPKKTCFGGVFVEKNAVNVAYSFHQIFTRKVFGSSQGCFFI